MALFSYRGSNVGLGVVAFALSKAPARRPLASVFYAKSDGADPLSALPVTRNRIETPYPRGARRQGTSGATVPAPYLAMIV